MPRWKATLTRTTTARGSAYFYSNAFSGTGASATALTTASFEPAEGNQFYHFGATPLYTAESEDSPAVAGSFDTRSTYYYQRPRGTVSNGVATSATEWVAISGLASDQVTRVNGQWQIKAGIAQTPRPECLHAAEKPELHADGGELLRSLV